MEFLAAIRLSRSLRMKSFVKRPPRCCFAHRITSAPGAASSCSVAVGLKLTWSPVRLPIQGWAKIIFKTNSASLVDQDCAFLALPHGQAMEVAPRIPANVKVIDLSGDFRLRDAAVFAQHYGREHSAMDAQSEFVYGLTETNREVIRTSRRVANPGCFA